MNIYLADEAATLKLGAQLAQLCPQQHFVIHLEGDLGAGKTTLSRGLLHALGHQGKVKSPTYTLVERYDVANKVIFHFDLYRVSDPEELEYLGLDDYFNHNSLCLIEWAKQGSEYLPKPDLIITLRYQDSARKAMLQPLSDLAINLCEYLKD